VGHAELRVGKLVDQSFGSLFELHGAHRRSRGTGVKMISDMTTNIEKRAAQMYLQISE
jgi:hypothetical protein